MGDWVNAVLVESGGKVCGVQLAEISTSSTKTDNWGKSRQVDEKNLKDILKRSTQGKIHLMSGFDVYIDPNASLTGKDILYFWLTDTRIYSSETRKLVIKGPKSLYKEDDVLSYARNIVSRFGMDYGCIAAGLTYFHVDATITFTHSSMVNEYAVSPAAGPDHPRKRFGEEISYYQSRLHNLGRYIPRASWGNILSPIHIEALGGEDRIRKESGAYLIERWGNNLYIQLTKSLWDCTNEDLIRLNSFFTPARFPDAPEPVYLDRESKAYTIY
jgi:hypothetical protein